MFLFISILPAAWSRQAWRFTIRCSSYAPNDVATICIGQAASIAALLLASGQPGKRYALPNARVLIHQPTIGGLSGQATDIDIHAREILRIREMPACNSASNGQNIQSAIEKIERDVERDFWMSAQQAHEYGILDEIIYKHKRTAGRPRR